MPIASTLRSGVLTALIVGLMALPGAGRAQDAVGMCGDSTVPHLFVDIESYPRLDLELARTPPEHEVGLMYREAVPADNGMLFVYQAESREGYWMYHTLIPLSIAFWGKNGRILRILNMAPCRAAPCKVYDPHVAFRGALEVNRGAFARWSVHRGSVVTIRRS